MVHESFQKRETIQSVRTPKALETKNPEFPRQEVPQLSVPKRSVPRNVCVRVRFAFVF